MISVRIRGRRIGVLVKKLRSGNYGEFSRPDGPICLEPRQSGKEFLDTVIHEGLHARFEDAEMSHVEVARTSGDLTRLLWAMGYRKVEVK